MSRVIVVGTLHLGLTRKNDLKALLEDIKPDQLLLELPEDENARQGDKRDEMLFAVDWAETLSKNTAVAYFDTDTSILKDGISEEDNDYQDFLKKQIAELDRYSWRDWNKKEPWQLGTIRAIESEFFHRYVDMDKWNEREEEMLKNVQRLKQADGTVLILTGAGHLDFFEKSLPDAEFIFRTNASVSVGAGNLAGKGVYANRDFQKEEIVIQYHLKPLTQEEFDSLPESEKKFVHTQQGVPYLYSEPERYVNHSDVPNTQQDFNLQADIASRDIRKGEEITTDAQKDDI